MEDKLDMQSVNWVNQNAQFLAERFPNCVTETAEGIKIDFDLLQQELSSDVIQGNKERYRLEWPGKREAIVTANLPTTKTIRPVREDSVDFDNTENLYIEGDNLEVLKLLQESYLGKIKMIYIDPPYNKGKDFIFKDNFTKEADKELLESGQRDEQNLRLVVNSNSGGRYHSDWLSMMYPRLKLSRNLLRKDGIIMLSIDETEVYNLKKICDEIFGENNFVGEIIWKNSSRNDQAFISIQNESILVYVRDRTHNDGNWKEKKEGLKEIYKAFEGFRKEHGDDWNAIHKSALEWYKRFPPSNPIYGSKHYSWMDEKGVYFPSDLSGPNFGQYSYDLIHPISGLPCKEPSRGWVYPESAMLERVEQNLIHFGKDHTTVPSNKTYLTQTEYQSIPSIKYKDGRAASKELRRLMGSDVFTNPKNVGLLSELIEAMQVKEDDIVLDFFSGSGTIAESIFQLNTKINSNCKFILIQIPEDLNETLKTATGGSVATTKRAIKYLTERNKQPNLCELAKLRVIQAAKKIKEETNADIDYGFRVYRLDSSNMQDVYYKPQDYNQNNLDLFGDNIKPDRTPDDLLTQVTLDWGLPLSLKIEQLEVLGKTVFKVAENSLYACFDNSIDEDFAKVIAKDQPLRIVFKDSGFKNDTAKTNVKQLLKQLSPETEMKVL